MLMTHNIGLMIKDNIKISGGSSSMSPKKNILRDGLESRGLV